MKLRHCLADIYWVRVFCVLSLCGIVALVGGCDTPMTPTANSAVVTPSAAARDPLYTPHARFGFGVSERVGKITDYDVSQLQAGWYSNWRFDPDPPRPAGLDYVQLVPVTRRQGPDLEALREAVLAQPGSLWLIGNEPERRALENQLAVHNYADLTPQLYARAYHELYHFIKELDPSAQVAIGGVVQPSPIRLEWLDQLLASYQELTGQRMPVDVWNIHIQIMREKRALSGCQDCWGAGIPAGLDDITEGMLFEIEDNVDVQILKDFVWAFRRWMKEQGEQDKPLIISEYGVLMPSDYLGETKKEGDAQVRRFMLDSFDFFLQTRDPEIGYPQDQFRLVQRWLWYSLNEVPYQYSERYKAWIGFNGALFDWRVTEYPGELTPLGEAFVDYMEEIETANDIQE
jgi:hypothetical protein